MTDVAWRGRRAFYHRHLAQFARDAGKPLRLTMIGGLPAIPDLALAYAKLTYIDTTAFIKAVYRQRAIAGNDGVLWLADPTERGEPVDGLLAHNIEVMGHYVERLINESRLTAPEGGSASMPEIPESEPSALARPAAGQPGR